MKRYKILVVDDDKIVADSLKDSIEFLDIYSATVAYSGKEALSLIKENNYDAFLVDQRMPEMTGVDFIRELLHYVENPLIYIITAEDDGIALAAAEKSLDQGGLPIKRYVSKPWSPSLFSVDLREDLREHELKQEMLHSIHTYSKKQTVIQKELHVALNKLVEKEKRDAALGGAISVISSAKHEIFNINTGISGNLELLEAIINELPLSDTNHKQHEKLKKIKIRLSILSDRIKEYVNFINLLTQKVTDPINQCSLNSIIDASLSDLSESIQQKQIEIIKDFTTDIQLPGYEKQLRLAFYHIISNSINAISDTGTILISFKSRDSNIVVRFEDTGKGILKDSIEKVFIPLFTQEKIYGGRGGSIVHKVITDFHKGTIEIESYTDAMIRSGKYPNKAQGTIITVTFPSHIDKGLEYES